MTTINIDAGDAADWPKVRSWDLGSPQALPTHLRSYATGSGMDPRDLQGALDAFMKLPAARAMPQEHKEYLRTLGLRVPEGGGKRSPAPRGRR